MRHETVATATATAAKIARFSGVRGVVSNGSRHVQPQLASSSRPNACDATQWKSLGAAAAAAAAAWWNPESYTPASTTRTRTTKMESQPPSLLAAIWCGVVLPVVAKKIHSDETSKTRRWLVMVRWYV
jgi:hypothetical protein